MCKLVPTSAEGYWLLDDLELIGLDGKKVEELLLKAGAKSLGMLNVTLHVLVHRTTASILESSAALTKNSICQATIIYVHLQNVNHTTTMYAWRGERE